MIDILKECRGAKNIAITGHTNPDGDCIGSCMGLLLFMQKAFPEAKCTVLLERPDPSYGVILGIDKIRHEIPEGENYDLVIVLDSVVSRCGFASAVAQAPAKVINIDHHKSNPGEGDVSWVEPDAAACGQVLYKLMCATQEGKALMDRDIALALYIAIIHDTGVLQYSNTSPETLRIVADLVSFGFDFTTLIDKTFYENTYVQSQVLGRSLLEAFPLMDGQVMVSRMEQRTMDFYGAVKSDLSGIVSQLRIIKGVKIAIFIYEVGPQEHKVSLRSGSDLLDVSKVATYFGGGGHIRAAGCNINGNFYDVLNAVMEQVEKLLAEAAKAE
ncbi:MAG: bifunctional oligoribonuclease/PAP phosphatase NrnA [Lachnospiraceae bacterium]|nr:bifunctional oligoribonuclease/PAP phosphatase NrnA [Lachnospiraceae bacterium]